MEHPPEAIPPSPLVRYIRETYTCDDYFQLLPKALDKNPDDAAARSYMLGIMMAKYLDEEYLQRAKRYVID